MPRLHPVYYKGNDADFQLTTAFAEADPSAAWALMKAGLATPTAENLGQIIHASYREDCYLHVGTKAPELQKDPLPLTATLVYSQPATAKAHARAQVRLANMLFAKKISPLESYPTAGNIGTGNSITYTTAAQEAFVLESHTKPNMALLSLIVVQAVKERPSWQPEIGRIFKNILEGTPEEETAKRTQQAEHINRLGQLVGSRLKSMPPAKTGLTTEQLGWWTDHKNWSINPSSQPTPTEAMRTSYKDAMETQCNRMIEALRKSGAFDGPAAG